MSDTTDTTNTPSDSAATADTSSTGKSGRCARGRGHRRHRRWRFFGLLAVLALGAFALPRAFAGGHGWGCHDDKAWTAEETREHMGWMAERGLDRVDASDAQREQVDAILDKAAPDMAALHDEAAALKDSVHSQLTTDATDRAALEEIRADALELADRASQRGLDLVVQIASVLTPDQRATLAEKMDHHR